MPLHSIILYICFSTVYAANRSFEAIQTDAKTCQKNPRPESETAATELYSSRLWTEQELGGWGDFLFYIQTST